MPVGSIVLPEAKPAYEWVRGRALQKMSPSRSHSILQRAFATFIHTWAAGNGWVGTEWRFRVTPQDGEARPLVPDVAYITASKLAALPEAEREFPNVAPDFVVQILSPGDRTIDVDHKREIYQSAGVGLVLIVDPQERTVQSYSEGIARSWSANDVVVCSVFPNLRIDLGGIFKQLDHP